MNLAHIYVKNTYPFQWRRSLRIRCCCCYYCSFSTACIFKNRRVMWSSTYFFKWITKKISILFRVFQKHSKFERWIEVSFTNYGHEAKVYFLLYWLLFKPPLKPHLWLTKPWNNLLLHLNNSRMSFHFNIYVWNILGDGMLSL